MTANALRWRQEEDPTWLQGIMESGNQPILQFRLQVDHQVAATDQVQLGEGRILDDVLDGEHHHLADFLLDPVAGIFLDEEATQPFRRDVGGDIGRIDTRAGDGDGIVIEVGTVELDLELAVGLVHELAQHNGDGIGLLAGRTAGHPDAKNIIVGFVGKQLRQDIPLEGDEGLRIPEKAGHVDQQLLE